MSGRVSGVPRRGGRVVAGREAVGCCVLVPEVPEVPAGRCSRHSMAAADGSGSRRGPSSLRRW